MSNIPKYKDLTIGMQFRNDKSKRTITIVKISHESNQMSYEVMRDHGPTNMLNRTVRGFHNMLNGFDYEYLEPMGQRIDAPNEVLCAHLNVRKERYFSAHVYETCKDCNKALN